MVGYLTRLKRFAVHLLAKFNPVNIFYRVVKPKFNQQLYIHVGMPKTGSSAIQAFLALNKDYLAKNGFAYPNHPGFSQAFQTSSGNVADMLKWIRNENTPVFDIFLKKVKSKNIILSSEILFVALNEDPEKFAKFLCNKKYKIIFYIREFTDLIESCLNQQIKNHYLVDCSNIDHIVSSFDYYKCLINATKYIEKNNIVVRRYADKQFYKGNIYADFMQIIGLEVNSDVRYPEKVVNPSLNKEALSFRIMLNKSFFGQKNINQKYNINGILAEYSVENKEPDNYKLLSLEQRKKMLSNYSSKEKELVTLFFNKTDVPLFDQKIEETKQYGELPAEKLFSILAFIKQRDLKLFNEIIEFTKHKLKDADDRSRILDTVNALQIQQ